MVESVANTALNSMIRTQSASTSNGVASLKSNKQATQAIISQLQDGATAQGASSSIQEFNTASATPSSNLPRGSLLDMVV